MDRTYKVVIPFYLYAGISFLASTIILFLSAPAFTQHYFHPHTLAITHAMALGWGTMIILGASHQLVPVIAETKLYSHTLAYISFIFAALGIPLLVYAFYVFDIGWPARLGGIMVNAAIIIYLLNLALSMSGTKKENVQSIFIFTATGWLLATTAAGLLLVYNFSYLFLPEGSLHYLTMHAHMGIIGWFLLLIIGVGSRLIPMFLISKYEHTKLLWWIYACVNTGLCGFVIMFLYYPSLHLYPLILVVAAIVLFAYYIFCAYKQRIRKRTDKPVRLSLLSVLMIALPALVLAFSWMSGNTSKAAMVYGFTIFFGWITAIILGMTFKTLPFIIWNRLYHYQSAPAKVPDPKDLFDARVFNWMTILYLVGFLLFIAGIFFSDHMTLKSSAILLIGCAVLYNFNVSRIVSHKAVNR